MKPRRTRRVHGFPEWLEAVGGVKECGVWLFTPTRCSAEPRSDLPHKGGGHFLNLPP